MKGHSLPQVKSMDVIVHSNIFPPGKPHEDMLILGYRFLCSHYSVERFERDDLPLNTRQRHVIAVNQVDGVNFYVKGLE